MRLLLVTSCLAFAGCGSLLGIDDFTTGGDVSPPPPGDTLPDAPPGSVPETITFSGQTVLDRGDFASPTIPNTQLVFLRGGSELIAESTTDASGNYAITIPTGGAALSGYLELEIATDAYVPRMYAFDLTGDRSVTITAFGIDRIAQLASAAGASQTTSTGVVFAKVVDPITGQGVSGATFDTGGVGQIRYEDDSTSAPGSTTTATGFSGDVWVFGVTGTVTLTAHVGGRSLARTLEVPPQSFTTVGFLLAP